eukprot:scaffold1554_cov332-Pavlova_lutheri.AAC.11
MGSQGPSRPPSLGVEPRRTDPVPTFAIAQAGAKRTVGEADHHAHPTTRWSACGGPTSSSARGTRSERATGTSTVTPADSPKREGGGRSNRTGSNATPSCSEGTTEPAVERCSWARSMDTEGAARPDWHRKRS